MSKMKEMFQKMLDGVIDNELLKFTAGCELYLTFYRQARVVFDDSKKITMRNEDTGEEKTYEGSLLTDPDRRINTIYKRFMDFIEVKTGEKPDKYAKVVREFSEALFAYLFYVAYRVVNEIKGYKYILVCRPRADGETSNLFPGSEDLVFDAKPVTLMEYYDHQVELYNISNADGEPLIKFVDKEDEPAAATMKTNESHDEHKQKFNKGWYSKAIEVAGAYQLIKDTIDASIKKWIADLDALEVKKKPTPEDLRPVFSPRSKATYINRFNNQKLEDIIGELDQDDKDMIAQQGIKHIGIRLPFGADRALHAIQTIMADNNFKSNIHKHSIDTVDVFNDDTREPRKKTIKVPHIQFTLEEYYDAYGVPKTLSDRGYYEYDESQRKIARACLENLEDTQFVLFQTFEEGGVFFDKGEARKTRPKKFTRKVVRPLFYLDKVYSGEFTIDEMRDDDGTTTRTGKIIAGFTLTPSAVLMLFDRHRRFVMSQRRLYEKIVEANPRHLETFKDLIHFLEYTKSNKDMVSSRDMVVTDNKIEINYKLLAGKLGGFARLIRKSEWGKIRATLSETYEDAVRAGWLESYQAGVKCVTGEKDILMLNPAYFYDARKADKKL